MSGIQVSFDKRLKRIVRRHERMANGVVQRVTSDGLIVARPRLYKPHFPLRSVAILMCVGFLFKGLALSYLGADDYTARLAALQQGNMVEQTGAWVMQSDPATRFIADQVAILLR
ncbi:MAG: hypothetical protein IBX59_07650 [Yoonia sp.]|nr:hypothetical protein [Yoonia sp.]